MPDPSASGYKKFVKLMGAPEDKIFLFAPDAHDQIAVAALAMEKAKSPVAAEWSKQIISVSNGPGESVDDVVDALALVRAGKPVNFNGAGSVCDFARMATNYNGNGSLGHKIWQARFHRVRKALSGEESVTARPEIEGEWIQGRPDRARARLMPSKDAEGRTIYARTPLLQLEGLITPTDAFYIVAQLNMCDPIHPDDYVLSVTGLVDRPMELKLADIQELPSRTIRTVMECAGDDGEFFHWQKRGGALSPPG